jgi:hypothetical protein
VRLSYGTLQLHCDRDESLFGLRVHAAPTSTRRQPDTARLAVSPSAVPSAPERSERDVRFAPSGYRAAGVRSWHPVGAGPGEPRRTQRYVRIRASDMAHAADRRGIREVPFLAHPNADDALFESARYRVAQGGRAGLLGRCQRGLGVMRAATVAAASSCMVGITWE